MIFNPKTITDLYEKASVEYKNRAAFAARQKNSQWKPVTFGELYEEGLALATSLIGLNVDFQEPVGLLSDNRMEWIKADYACQLCGAVDVPRGSDITPDEIVYILNHCRAKAVFVENLALLEKIFTVKERLPLVKHWILMNEEEDSPEGIHHLKTLTEEGRKKRENGSREAEERIARITPEHLFTLIYTSGTTGGPKGVMLTHGNMISQIVRLENAVDISPLDRILSILPVWHIFERMFEMYTILNGCCTYYTNVRNIADDLKNVRPTFMGSAPRLWESIYAKIMANVEKSHPVRQGLFHIAYFLSRLFKQSVYFLTFRQFDDKGRHPLFSLIKAVFHLIRWVLVLPFYGLFNASVLERLRLAAGGDLKASVSGGGALPLHIDEFFNYIGIPVLEGYGMTETSPVIACRTSSNLVIGTVGPIFPDTDIRIVDVNTGRILYPDPASKHQGMGLKGEIHVKGPQVMKGYYRDEQATREVLKDGWMNSGDLGMITFNRCLKIMGRTKDTIVLTSGENVDPTRIEVKLLDSLLIDRVMAVGQDRKYIGALIIPSLEGFKKAGIDKTLEALCADPKVNRLIDHEIKTRISTAHGYKLYELVQGFRLIDKPFEVGDEITNLFKLKRHVISQKYSRLIDAIYQGE